MISPFFKKLIAGVTLAGFLLTSAAPARALDLPAPGTMVAPGGPFNPPLLKGIRVYPDDAMRFDFILDKGDDLPPGARTGQGEFPSGPQEGESSVSRSDTERLIGYFLASLTTPSSDMWVNLSPYEGNRIIPEKFGLTTMGRDLLAQDYILKQISASLLDPDSALGKKYWERVYALANERFGTTDIPLDTFNKVWIVPAVADVAVRNNAAYIVNARMKLMLDTDYQAASMSPSSTRVSPEAGPASVSALTTRVMREVVLPELERALNEGADFAQVRQVYHSLILAAWLKKRLQQPQAGNALSRGYVDRNKTPGVEHGEAGVERRIWEQYVAAFKKGVVDLVREERDAAGDVLPRKYFSGGADYAHLAGLIREVPADRVPASPGVLIRSVFKDTGRRDSSAAQADNKVLFDGSQNLSVNGVPGKFLGGGSRCRLFIIGDRVFRIFKSKKDEFQAMARSWGQPGTPEDVVKAFDLGATAGIAPQVHSFGYTAEGYGYVEVDLVRAKYNGGWGEEKDLSRHPVTEEDKESVAELFRTMAAHGLWMEDLTPSNIMLTVKDGRTVAMIADAELLKRLGKPFPVEKIFNQIYMGRHAPNWEGLPMIAHDPRFAGKTNAAQGVAADIREALRNGEIDEVKDLGPLGGFGQAYSFEYNDKMYYLLDGSADKKALDVHARIFQQGALRDYVAPFSIVEGFTFMQGSTRRTVANGVLSEAGESWPDRVQFRERHASSLPLFEEAVRRETEEAFAVLTGLAAAGVVPYVDVRDLVNIDGEWVLQFPGDLLDPATDEGRAAIGHYWQHIYEGYEREGFLQTLGLTRTHEESPYRAVLDFQERMTSLLAFLAEPEPADLQLTPLAGPVFSSGAYPGQLFISTGVPRAGTAIERVETFLQGTALASRGLFPHVVGGFMYRGTYMLEVDPRSLMIDPEVALAGQDAVPAIFTLNQIFELPPDRLPEGLRARAPGLLKDWVTALAGDKVVLPLLAPEDLLVIEDEAGRWNFLPAAIKPFWQVTSRVEAVDGALNALEQWENFSGEAAPALKALAALREEWREAARPGLPVRDRMIDALLGHIRAHKPVRVVAKYNKDVTGNQEHPAYRVVLFNGQIFHVTELEKPEWLRLSRRAAQPWGRGRFAPFMTTEGLKMNVETNGTPAVSLYYPYALITRPAETLYDRVGRIYAEGGTPEAVRGRVRAVLADTLNLFRSFGEQGDVVRSTFLRVGITPAGRSVINFPEDIHKPGDPRDDGFTPLAFLGYFFEADSVLLKQGDQWDWVEAHPWEWLKLPGDIRRAQALYETYVGLRQSLADHFRVLWQVLLGNDRDADKAQAAEGTRAPGNGAIPAGQRRQAIIDIARRTLSARVSGAALPAIPAGDRHNVPDPAGKADQVPGGVDLNMDRGAMQVTEDPVPVDGPGVRAQEPAGLRPVILGVEALENVQLLFQ